MVVRPDSVRLVSIKNQDSISKVLDMVPDVLEKFAAGKKIDTGVTITGEEALHAAFPERNTKD